jgi:hypothetical protein
MGKALAHLIVGLAQQLKFIMGSQLDVVMVGDLSVFHGIRQLPQGLEDYLAKLDPEKENKSKKRKGGKKQHKRQYVKFGFCQRGVVPDKEQ